MRLAPFLGVLGMPPPEPGIHSTTPPRPTAAATSTARSSSPARRSSCRSRSTARCSRPATVTARRATARCRGTAIECPLERAQLTLDVRDDLDLRWPIARTADAWLTFGFDEDLDIAAEIALETMLDLMERERGIDRRTTALALASRRVDLRVTQVVNRVKGVHAVLRDDALG